ncbi:hypothetical protein GC163_10820 [bacterium]|nr:hypothetical protein [bacterium]
MDCRQAKHWIALIAGQDPTDSQTAGAVRQHVEHCADCRCFHASVGQALSVLPDARREVRGTRRLWPRVAQRLSELDVKPQFLRFNVWIPTVLASAACLLLVSVAIVEVQQQSGQSLNWQAANERNLFQSDPQFNQHRAQQPTPQEMRQWGMQPGGEFPELRRQLDVQPARSRLW